MINYEKVKFDEQCIQLLQSIVQSLIRPKKLVILNHCPNGGF